MERVQKGRHARPYYDRDFETRDFTPEGIEEGGEHLLFRALNIGRAIGFIGSGISAAYGRPTWTDLINEIDGEIAAVLGATNDPVWLATKDLQDAFVAGISDPDLLPLRGHMLRLSSQREVHRRPDEVEWEGSDEPLGAGIKRRSVNDDFIAQHVWGQFYDPNVQRRVEHWRRLDTRRCLKALVLQLKSKASSKIKRALEDVEAALGEGPSLNVRLSAEERFIVLLLLSLWHAQGKNEDVIRDLEREAASLRDFPDQDPDSSRPTDADPIRLIVDGLRIHRLLTTNYDFELERELERLGFVDPGLRPVEESKPARRTEHSPSRTPGELVAHRPRGDAARSVVFTYETSADLIDFAVRASEFHYEVFHLHGRAGKDDPLVVTERDYQQTYLRSSPARFTMTEALQVVFAGNPIIFLGMGMVEADLLRPLRRFVSDRAQINRSIVALLPTEEARPRRVRTALQLYLRYGVHVIFYGGAIAAANEKGGLFGAAPWLGDADVQEADDSPLYRFIVRIAALRRALDSDKKDRPRAELKKLRGGLERGEAGKYVDGLRKPANVFGVEAAGRRLINPSLDLLQACLNDKQFVQALSKIRPVRDGVREFLKLLDARVRSRALCEKLTELIERRRTWWSDWLELPKARPYIHRFEVYQDKSETWEPRSDLSDWQSRELRSRVLRYGVEGDRSSDSQSPLQVLSQILSEPPSANPPKRRVFAVHAGPGAGRGSLFHLLSTRFVDAKDGAGKPRYGWALFTNAAFSPEYSSVVDGALDYFWKRSTKNPGKFPDHRVGPRKEALLELMRRLFDGQGGGLPVEERRGLVAFGGAELLYREDGSPKNFDIAESVEFLVGKDSEHRPIDIVLFLSTDRFEQLERTRQQLNLAAAKRIQLPFPEKFERLDLALKSVKFTLKPMHQTFDAFAEKVCEAEIWAVPYGRFQTDIIVACAWATSCDGDDLAAVEEFLVALSDEVRRASDDRPRSSASRQSEVVLASVLGQYAMLGPIGGADPVFCELLLKHLSIMSCPAEQGVLAACPQISAWLAKHNKPVHDHLRIVAEALKVLNDRHLVFKIALRGDAGEQEHEVGDGEYFERYAVHRSMQSFFFRRMGSPHLEFGDSRLFTVSLYASQPVDLPAPTKAAYDFMAELIRDLIGFPKAAQGSEPPRTILRTENERRKDVCSLRAAVGLVRSAFSLAVVARFAEFGDPKDERPTAFGYLEGYRLLLRWMIYRAGVLGDEETPKLHDEVKAYLIEKKKEIEQEPDPEERKKKEEKLKKDGKKSAYKEKKKWRLNALYQDEITWMYNECGLVSLAQGNLYDAVALFRQARDSNNLVEFESSIGPNALRIRLNLAYAEIERGNLSRADRSLETIIRQTSKEKEPIIHAIATGYRGVVAHLRGRFEQAERLYDGALDMLKGRAGEARALGIFNRHLGDLFRLRHQMDKAQEHLRAARAEAETARQQDLVHRVLVAQARYDLAKSDNPDLRKVLQQLDQAERYADIMELHSLKAESLTVRAKVFEMQGETRIAGEVTVAALSLATLHGMRLRVMIALAGMGRIAIERGYIDQARRILTATLGMSERAGYQLCAEEVDRRLIEINGLKQP